MVAASDQAPLGRGVGCGVWGVGKEIAPTTSGSQSFSLGRLHWSGFQAPKGAVFSPTP
jgi:hypothetical protein